MSHFSRSLSRLPTLRVISYKKCCSFTCRSRILNITSSLSARSLSCSSISYSNVNSLNPFEISELDSRQFEKFSETALSNLTDQFEDLIQEYGSTAFDVEYSSGVLTLSLGEHGTYVLNKQPPNKQIWLSSPISGPKRYDYDLKSSKWFYHRDNSTLEQLLESELVNAFNTTVKLSLN